jgi:predicted RND superfamily exporter protein
MSTVVSEVRAASIMALMMEAASTSETSVGIQLSTRQYIPEDSELQKEMRSFNSAQNNSCPYC